MQCGIIPNQNHELTRYFFQMRFLDEVTLRLSKEFLPQEYLISNKETK